MKKKLKNIWLYYLLEDKQLSFTTMVEIKSDQPISAIHVNVAMDVTTYEEQRRLVDPNYECSAVLNFTVNSDDFSFTELLRIFVESDELNAGLLVFPEGDDLKADIHIDNITEVYYDETRGFPKRISGNNIECKLTELSDECCIIFCFWCD